MSAQNQAFTTKLPIVYIDTHGEEIRDDPRIKAKLEIAWNHTGDENSTTDPRNHFNGDIKIEIRGSSSQMFPKKSYGFELKDEFDEDMDFPLLGMPEEEDWILYAPYTDKTLIRNVLTLTLAEQISDVYAPRCRYVELFVNNEYDGVYVLMEQIKRDSNRVDIAKLKEDDLQGEELTGGYIIKVDKFTGSGGDGWNSEYSSDNSKTFYQYDYPKSSEIQPEQKQYIQNYMHNFETAVYNNEHSEENGYQNYMNSESFFDYIFMNELSRNVDGYRLSTYLYKDKNDKLNAGPLWDFNLSFGNANYLNGWETFGLQVHEYLGDDNWKIPFWWKNLMGDAYFTNPMKCRWEFLREVELSDERIFSVTDSLINHIELAAVRNFERWPILGEWIWPNYFVGDDYESEVSWMKNWMTERIRVLDYSLPGDCGADPGLLPVDFSVSIFPNPFTTNFSIEIESKAYLIYNLKIFTVNGTLVQNEDLHISEGLNSIKVNTSNLQSGMFIYRLIKGNTEMSVGKIIKI
ncbi:MAG: CotH kinase family protein [Draconibacterium sp.]|nr:CotH kinase family protein [Draconibacterium sp.]